MRWPTYRYRWTWDLDSAPDDLWPLISDTNRFDEAAGLSAVELRGAEADSPDRVLGYRSGWFDVEWVQAPFEWARPFGYRNTRRFRTGPVGRLVVDVALEPLEFGGTRLHYHIDVTARNVIGAVAIPRQVGRAYRKRFEAVSRSFDAVAALEGDLTRAAGVPGRGKEDEKPSGLPIRSIQLARHAPARLASARAQLVGDTDEKALDAVLGVVQWAEDTAAGRIRPYELADRLGLTRRATLEACLSAARAGVLDLRWELLCPSCRAPGSVVADLRDSVADVHCEGCKIDFRSDFSRSVELTFRPAPAIRVVPEGVMYCFAGPGQAAHVAAQQVLRTGEVRSVRLRLGLGTYRLAARNAGGSVVHISVEPAGDGVEAPRPTRLSLTAAGWVAAGGAVATDAPTAGDAAVAVVSGDLTLELSNETPTDRVVVLEQTNWSTNAVTAADVIALQRFRDLFGDAILRPGDMTSVGTQTVVFTDLRSSTAMYRRIGDAPAFGIVMDHFTVLKRAVEQESGAVVKTIGDAVMAVFREPTAAVRAMLSAQDQLAVGSSREGGSSDSQVLSLKVGVHHGPCIAVTLDQRLDYFGSTVNAAARLVGHSTGSDIVVSDVVHNDPSVQSLLVERADSVRSTAQQVNLRGFEDQQTIWRLTQRSGGAPPPGAPVIHRSVDNFVDNVGKTGKGAG